MKKLYMLLLLIVGTAYAQQQPFITTWQILDFDLEIMVPVTGTNYTIDFGDGTVLHNQSGPVTHTYASEGMYTMVITGINSIRFGGLYDDATRIKTIEQWGDTQWTTMEEAFKDCMNLVINATDVPNLSQVTSTRAMFQLAYIAVTPVHNWDVSNVTDMSYMFNHANAFDVPLDSWDVSNVTNMEYMLANAGFNQPLASWDVSNVTNMKGMFNNAQSFNQPIGNWNVSNVTDMSEMFMDAYYFNQPLNAWNVANVTTMKRMFSTAQQFNQPIGNWNVANVTDMSSMFFFAQAFNQPLNNWDVSNVTTMNSMFRFTSVFDQPLSNWDVLGVTDMLGMFGDNPVFNQPLEMWNVSDVTDMSFMFSNTGAFNQPLNNWNMSNVINASYMFSFAQAFNQPLNNWDVSNITNLMGMFSHTEVFNQPLDNWEIKDSAILNGVFFFAINFNQDISGWNFPLYSPLNEYSIASFSGMDTNNYDALLLKLASYNYQDIKFAGHGLRFCNETVRNFLISELGWIITGDSLGEECEGNNVTGTMLIDENLNGCDATDAPAVNFMVQATNSANYSYATFVNSNGNYDVKVQNNTYTVAPVNVPDYFTVTPPSAEVSFTGFGNSEALNFCLVPNQSIQDLNVTVLPIGDARPGFASEYKILVENIGTQTVTGASVSLTFDTTLQSFVSASPAPATTNANQLTFNVGNIGVFETKAIDFVMTTLLPPAVNGGEVAVFTATVTPDAADNTPDDNTFTLNQTIVNSFDPNDKRVVQGEEIFIEQKNDYLDYIIRFQNTGTASAITVRVEDVLSEELDWTTLKPTASSHSYRVEVTEGNTVNFIFDNINLPHEDADEEGSNGYIAYRIKPKQNIQSGDVISGNAGIFFDFNLPIITNTVTTTVVEPLGVKQHAKGSVSIYPNPASSIVHIQPKAGTLIEGITLYNLQGRELMKAGGNTQSLDVGTLSAGVYMLQVKTSTGQAGYKLVKK